MPDAERPSPIELPQAAAPPRERADAARNRESILAAAARLFAEHGVTEVPVERIAAEAGVGKGTVFRRFGDKSGLAAALLDARERDLQRDILSGPPPLGPGAAAADRLLAFVAAYTRFLAANLDIVHLLETASPGARYRVGAYRFWHRHLRLLLAEARPDLDAGYLAHALLAPLGAEPWLAHTAERSPDEAAAGALTLARLVLSGTPAN